MLLPLTDKEVADLVHQSAFDRGRGDFQKSINAVDAALSRGMEEDAPRSALALEGFKAAKEAGDTETAKRFARIVAEEDPELPSIQDYL